MIRAFIYDLDGTLLQTELLKARAYAEVVGRLLRRDGPENWALDVYRAKVGSPDEAIARSMIDTFRLEAPIASVADSPESPWETLHRLRTTAYLRTHGAPKELRRVRFQPVLDTLHRAAGSGLAVAVATSSYKDEARRVLTALGALKCLSLLLGRDSVSNPKPHPEIYLNAMQQLAVSPDEALIIEDSPVGLEAAAASGARWVCAANDWTAEPLRLRPQGEQRWIAYEHEMLGGLIEDRMREAAEGSHSHGSDGT